MEKEYYSERDAQRFVRTIADTLNYCHIKDIVHRDLKPENVLLNNKTDDASIKIADFGFAKKEIRQSLDSVRYRICRTRNHQRRSVRSGRRYVVSRRDHLHPFMRIPALSRRQPSDALSSHSRWQVEFDSPYWDEVSEEAKDLIRGLLNVDASARLTAAQVLSHKWIKGEASDKDITPALSQLRKYQARRRWKKGIMMAKATTSLPR